MKEEKVKKSVLSIVPKIAKKVGERSVAAACFWWFNQPKVPETMKKDKINKIYMDKKI